MVVGCDNTPFIPFPEHEYGIGGTVGTGGAVQVITRTASGGHVGSGGHLGSGGATTCTKKMCGGECVFGSPSNGCSSTSCYSCPIPAPESGFQICNDQGQCDFECFPGFTKSVGECVVVDACVLTTHVSGLGQNWQDCVPLGVYDVNQAVKACRASGASHCLMSTGCGGGELVVCGYAEDGTQSCWGYAGSIAGYVGSTARDGGGACPGFLGIENFTWG